jgi:hypothetical protein
MKLRERYRRLTFWNKFAFWGSLASIVGLLLGVYPLTNMQTQSDPLRPEDFRLRFAVSGHSISEQDLNRAPRVLHCIGKMGGASVQFDLRLIETVVNPSSRGRAPSEIWYEADHFIFYDIASLNQTGIDGQYLQFLIPIALRGFAGDGTRFRADLFIRGKWYFTGYEPFEDGNVSVRIGRRAAA